MKNEQTQEANTNGASQRKSRSKSKAASKLALVVSTWEKQSHGLFDYHSLPDKITKEFFDIGLSSQIIRNLKTRKTTIKSIKNQTKDSPDNLEIFRIQSSPCSKFFHLKNSLSTNFDELMLGQRKQAELIAEKHKLFISLEPNEAGHQLMVGDFIKLGRVQLIVLQINNEIGTKALDFGEVYGTREFIFDTQGNLQGICKICLSDETSKSDPLVNPCDCKGSCGVIHLQCLKNWINNKVKKQFYYKVRTYNFEKFSCQICKALFPTMIRLEDGSQTFLLNFQKPSTQYILLEQCSQSEQKNAKTLHFVFPNKDTRVQIGRGQDCELYISDISVSRKHSFISYNQNRFYIQDSFSKFGTLIELKTQLSIHKKVRLQHNECSIEVEPKPEKTEKDKTPKSLKKSQSKNLVH